MDIGEVEDYSRLEEILEEASWQEFEEIVGKVFEFHDYLVDVGEVLVFDDTKRQYDVISRKEDYIIVADCKNWDNKRRIRYGLKEAVGDQIERVEMLDRERVIYPLIVTSDRNPVEYYSGVPIIPVFKLNRFLLNFEDNRKNILDI